MDEDKQGSARIQAEIKQGVIDGIKADLLVKTPALAARNLAIKTVESELAALQAAKPTAAADIKANADRQALLSGQVAEAKKALDELVTKAANDRYTVVSVAAAGTFDQREYGRYLFENKASSGQYGCARCHTKGFSYNGANVNDKTGKPLFPNGLFSGGGWFGPNLTNGVTTRQFETPASHADFIASGSKVGIRYGQFGQGSGKMPGFGARTEDNCQIPPPVGEGGPPAGPCVYTAILTEAQINAIVAYERGL